MSSGTGATDMATGLGGAAAAKRAPNMQLIETVTLRTGTDDPVRARIDNNPNYDVYDAPAVVRRGRQPHATAGALPSFDATEIPAFLRKQAD